MSEPKQGLEPNAKVEPPAGQWPLPSTEDGTVGEALRQLGVPYSNGITYWSDYQKISGVNSLCACAEFSSSGGDA